MKLLTIQNDAKTVKGEAFGYVTAVMYLAPYTLSGINVCPFAKQAKCHGPCLNTAGHGVFNTVQQGRLKRTNLFHNDRSVFLHKLLVEIDRFVSKAEKLNLKPAVRLNGTSDIDWTAKRQLLDGASIFQMFPEVQFYDYTKVTKRLYEPKVDNYHVTLSYSGASKAFSDKVWQTHADTDCNVAVVVRDDSVKAEWTDNPIHRTVDGDQHDLRFLDPRTPPGTIVLLKAKGRARSDLSGFVVDEG